MAHILILMNTCADELRGDATTGKIVELQTAFNAVDSWMQTAPPGNQYNSAHDLMEQVQAWLCDGGEFTLSACAQCDEFIGALNEYL